jgi:hypothetical protein
MCVNFIFYLEEKETPKTSKKNLTIEKRQRSREEMEEESRNNGLADERIVRIKATFSSR